MKTRPATHPAPQGHEKYYPRFRGLQFNEVTAWRDRRPRADVRRLMRIWSLHPEHLDRQALVACWRETLLAQAVLAGRTAGYRSHPQLERFRATPEPLGYVGAYLAGLADEADVRGYRFDRSRILAPPAQGTSFTPLEVTTEQVALEWRHLLAKLDVRSPDVATANRARHAAGRVDVHPLFSVVVGPVATWERATG